MQQWLVAWALCASVLHRVSCAAASSSHIFLPAENCREAHRRFGNGINLTRRRRAECRSLTTLSHAGGKALDRSSGDGRGNIRHDH